MPSGQHGDHTRRASVKPTNPPLRPIPETKHHTNRTEDKRVAPFHNVVVVVLVRVGCVAVNLILRRARATHAAHPPQISSARPRRAYGAIFAHALTSENAHTVVRSPCLRNEFRLHHFGAAVLARVKALALWVDLARASSRSGSKQPDGNDATCLVSM